MALLLATVMAVEPTCMAVTVYAEESTQPANVDGSGTEGEKLAVNGESTEDSEKAPKRGENADVGAGEAGREEDTDEAESAGDGTGAGDRETPAGGQELEDVTGEENTTGDSTGGEDTEDKNSEDKNTEDENRDQDIAEDTDENGEKTEEAEEIEGGEEHEEYEEIEGAGKAEEESEEESEPEASDMEEENSAEEEELFSGMPENYRLTSEQQEEKELLSDNIDTIEEAEEGIRYVEGQIMTLADSREEAEMIAEAYNAQIDSFEDGLLVMKLSEEVTVYDAVRAAASARTTLPAVWPNYYRYAYGNESDISMPDIYAQDDEEAALAIEDYEETYEAVLSVYNDPDLISDSSQYQWQHVAVGSPYAWQQGYTGSGIKVAVIDSGVSAHDDLVIKDSTDKSDSGSTEDGLGHGTHVAGIIGATADNHLGGAGIAPDSELYNIRVLMSNGAGSDDMIWHGLNQAVEWDVDIINMSLGGPGYNGLLQDKINEAYEKGIAVFAAAGNDGVSCINYPACFDNVICVAASDTNSVRAEFSTFGSWVDLTAPGVNIWSTYKNNDYALESGTSMACPVAAGEAAVLLSAHDSLKSMAKGKERVDALETLMKRNSIKVTGSGMGTGITSLTKAFNLSTASVKPQAPVITILSDENRQSLQVEIKAQAGMRIYYTTNGKSPAFRNGEPSASTGTMLYDYDVDRPLVISDGTKVTIKAIAVNESGVSSAVKTASYTLKPYVTDIVVSGVQQVVPGKSIQLSAAVSPSYATNKKVQWSLQTEDHITVDTGLANTLGIKISTSGKVTVSSNASPGKYTVLVTAQDDGRKQVSYAIEVIDKYRVKRVAFSKQSVSLVMPEVITYDLSQLLVTEAVSEDILLSSTDFKWTSSNKNIMTVDEAGVVTLHKAGTAKITALANDSSGKKAACTIKVTQLAETVAVSCPTALGGNKEVPVLAVGKSVTFKASVTPSWTTNKKVTWELYKDGKKIDKKEDAAFARETGVSISTAGKVTASRNAQPGTYTVRAVSKDQGAVSSEEQPLFVTDGVISKFAFVTRADAKVALFRKKAVSDTITEKSVAVEIVSDGAADLDAYKVTNSNPGIATVQYSREDNIVTLTIAATGNAAGKTNITISSTDGSNRKLTCAVTVRNPVSRIHIASNTVTSRAYKVNMCVVKGRSIQLKATLESEYGTPSDKRVLWSISAPAGSGVKISRTGKVTASSKASAGQTYTVTAAARDGSGVTASYVIQVVNRATYISTTGLSSGSRVINELPQYPDKDGLQQFFQYRMYSDISGGYVQSSSSNKNIVEATTYQGYLLLTPRKPGTATITLKATDGSGVKATYKIRVTNEVYTE